MVSLAWYDVVGTLGVVIVLVAYFLLQTARLDGTSLAYSVINLVGAMLITVSLLYEFNFSAFVIEIFWMAISIYGIVRARRAAARLREDVT
jgi:hypothetical protein